jgi:hypothetical protein
MVEAIEDAQGGKGSQEGDGGERARSRRRDA